jgi:hypothetical protein
MTVVYTSGLAHSILMFIEGSKSPLTSPVSIARVSADSTTSPFLASSRAAATVEIGSPLIKHCYSSDSSIANVAMVTVTRSSAVQRVSTALRILHIHTGTSNRAVQCVGTALFTLYSRCWAERLHVKAQFIHDTVRPMAVSMIVSSLWHYHAVAAHVCTLTRHCKKHRCAIQC